MTPVIKDFDSVFPGENWFLYWKTSSSLWSAKLSEFQEKYIIIPLNWSFHSETGEKYDFANQRSETDLKRLVEITQKLNKTIIFLLPVTPAPFLSNGGLPHLLARNISTNFEKMTYGIPASNGQMNKLHSFFDPRVFQAFRKYMRNLSSYFSKQNISAAIWGIQCGYFQHGKFRDYIEDQSKAFQDAFKRYLEIQKTESHKEDSVLIRSSNDEYNLIQQFIETINTLYIESAKEFFPENWEGIQRISFIGGSPEEIMKRMMDADDLPLFSSNIFNSICNDIIPSSLLIPPKIKDGIINKQLNDLVVNSYMQHKLISDLYESNQIDSFRPLIFFEIIQNQKNYKFDIWKQVGIWSYIEQQFGWTFRISTSIPEEMLDGISAHSNKIHFFDGNQMTPSIFHSMLKIFINGGKIIFNQDGLAKQLSKKFEIFCLENSLKTEQINLHSLIQNISLGEGRIVIFASENIKELDCLAKNQFWDKLIQTFEIPHLKILCVPGMDYSWQTRPASPSELNYEEIRRLNIYNQTSYKKKTKINLATNFVLLKIVDQTNVKIQSYSKRIEVELLPSGSVSMDFGLFF